MSADADRKSLSITLSGALFGFSVSLVLWSLCTGLSVNPVVPEVISDAVCIAGLIVFAIRVRRVVKR